MRRRTTDNATPREVDSFNLYRSRTGGDYAAWRRMRLAYARAHPDALNPLDALLGAVAVRFQLEGQTTRQLPTLGSGHVLRPDGSLEYVRPAAYLPVSDADEADDDEG